MGLVSLMMFFRFDRRRVQTTFAWREFHWRGTQFLPELSIPPLFRFPGGSRIPVARRFSALVLAFPAGPNGRSGRPAPELPDRCRVHRRESAAETAEHRT